MPIMEPRDRVYDCMSCYTTFSIAFDASEGHINNRPIEDALNERIAELEDLFNESRAIMSKASQYFRYLESTGFSLPKWVDWLHDASKRMNSLALGVKEPPKEVE